MYGRYDGSMDQRIGIAELREQLGRRVDAAYFLGENTVIEKNGEPRAVLVPYAWWRDATKAEKEQERP